MSKQVPSIGRVVHYVLSSGAHRPAWVIETSPLVLMVFTRHADQVGQVLEIAGAAEDTDGTPETWHWPEYVPATETDDDPASKPATRKGAK